MPEIDWLEASISCNPCAGLLAPMESSGVEDTFFGELAGDEEVTIDADAQKTKKQKRACSKTD